MPCSRRRNIQRTGLTLSGFPYNQMHHYVEKITACYAKYTELYGA